MATLAGSVLLALALAAACAAPAQAQMGQVNLFPTPNLPLAPPSLNSPSQLNNPFPSLPWGWNIAPPPDYGRLVLTWEIPDEIYVLDTLVPQPGSLPPIWTQVPVTVPGYTVAETTTGYLYPGRWTVVPAGAGGYRWQWMPPAFYRR